MTAAEQTFTGTALAERLGGLPGWGERDGALERRYATTGWGATLMAANAIGFLAEAADHHPDLQLSWGSLTVRLNTHSAGGITDKDIALAREVEGLALWHPGAGSALRGPAKRLVRDGSDS